MGYTPQYKLKYLTYSNFDLMIALISKPTYSHSQKTNNTHRYQRRCDPVFVPPPVQVIPLTAR